MVMKIEHNIIALTTGSISNSTLLSGGPWEPPSFGERPKAVKCTEPDGGRRRIQSSHLGAGKWLVEGISGQK